MTYKGLPTALKRSVFERDGWRCRWCGVTNRGLDAHHIRYRRGEVDDVLENLISLCRAHHDFVHGGRAGNGATITKRVAQLVLQELVARPGLTGMALWRQWKRRWVLEGRCLEHGEAREACPDCLKGRSGKADAGV